ncbi:NACHT domain-containing protein [Nonomuraea longicatena]|uniref:NACHT domain-containing protein n=1 Tax=Nonomuraea longicatena TaxID=83682 RepID=A0ABN1QZ86_9ACTN
MALETVALGLGRAVGDRALRTVLTHHAGKESRDRDLVELMRAHFPDQLVRRKAERQLEDIADAVTARVLKVCAHEFPGLEDHDRQAVLAEVTATLQAADLSDRALLSVDADPLRLARAVREGLPVPKGLGEAAGRLYEVVLDECCDCLVRIVRQLPEFQPRAAAEMLSRLSGVGEQVAAVLERLPVRTLEAPDGTDRDAEFRRRYLEHMSRTLDSLELLGVRVKRFQPRTSLSVAYVSLSVSAARDRAEPETWHGAPAEPATMRVESALGQWRWVLLRGEAGGGKSTLLRWLAVTAARGGFEGKLAGWNGCVPFLVKLRSYADRELPRPEQLLDLVAGPLAGLMPAGWAHRQLAFGRPLLLVDGVDELTGDQRKAIRPWLGGLLAEFSALRVVVTSRPSAAGAAWLEEYGFAPVYLERMTPADTRALVEHWHEAIRSSEELPCSTDQLSVIRARLLSNLEGTPHLRALAATPLLASMLCALNLDRVAQLPPDRMSLYAAALEMLLDRRDAERAIPSYAELNLDRPQKIQILQDLAWRLSMTNRVELPKSAALARVKKIVAAMPRVQADGAAVFKYLLERSGVIREPVEGRIDFIHRTVQEYLTARAAAEDGDIEPLVKNAHLDQWREVVIMAAGHANGPLREELLKGLLARIAAEPAHARRLKVLLCACLETLPSVPESVRQDVDRCVNDLVPPCSEADAASLAAAGQMMLDRLPRDLDGLSVEAAFACVRTAWLVNGPRALELLARYAVDRRDLVGRELIAGWRFFDPHVYAERVIAPMRAQVDFIIIHTPGQLSAFSRMPAKRGASIHIPVMESLSEVLPHRRWLVNLSLNCRLSRQARRDIGEFRKLEYLLVRWVDDLDFLRDLRRMHRLALRSVSEETDLDPLRSLPLLRTLHLQDVSWLLGSPSFPVLGGLRELMVVDAAEVRVRDIVERTPAVRSLRLNRIANVVDLQALSQLNLERLTLTSAGRLDDVSPLAGCVALKELLLLEFEPGLDLAPLAGNSRLVVRVPAEAEVRNGELLGRRLRRWK